MVQDRVTYYDKCNRFYLSPNDYNQYEPQTVVDVSLMTRVDEPVGWDNVNVVLNRDLGNHGVTTSFTDGEQELQFECKAGRSLLRQSYLDYGTDAQVKFLFGDFNDATSEFTVEFSADCNFNNFKFDDLYSSVNVELRDFASILRSKFDIEVPLDVEVAEAVEVGLASKVLPERVVLKHTGFGIFQRTSPTQEPQKAYFMPQYGEGARTKFDELLIPNYDGSFVGENPKNIKRYLFQVEKSGTFEINVNTCLEFPPNTQLAINTGTIRLKTAIWRESTGSFLGVGASIAPNRVENVTTYGFLVARRAYFENITFSQLELPSTLFAGDEVYLYFELTNPSPIVTGRGEVVRIGTDGDYNYELIVNSVFPSSFVKALPIKVAAQQVLDGLLADIPAYSGATIESDFLDNCDTLLITNGLTLRDANTTNSLDVTPKVSMQDIVETLKTVYAFGISLEPDNLTKRVRLEPYKYFYKNDEIIKLLEPYDYSEESFGETTYNEVEVGFDTYSKQRDDSSDFKDSSLNDVHAISTFTTPIKTNKATYTKRSPIIFSGYEIEAQRRIQFQEKEIENAKSYKNDDAIFAISYINRNRSRTISATSIDALQITLVGVVKPFIKVGDSISVRTVDDAPIGTVTVATIEYNGLNTDITYTGTDLGIPLQQQNVNVALSRIVVFNNTASRPVQEGDENFVGVSGIAPTNIDVDDFLESEYNLRFTPARILLAHAGLINNCLLEKSGSEEIKFVESEGNTVLATTLSGFFTCINGDETGKTLVEGGNIILSDFNNQEAPYRNRLIRFSHVIDWDDFNSIRLSMLNKAVSTNFGYITFSDLDGVERKGFLMNLDFSVVENKGDFELLEIGVATEPPPIVTRLNVGDKESTVGEACAKTEVTDTFFTDDVTPIVGSRLYLTSLLTGDVVPDFYKWFLNDGTSKVIGVDINSEIVSIADCPTVYEVNIGFTNFGSGALACQTNDNTVVRYSEDAVLVVGSLVFLDEGLTSPLSNGFYKIAGGKNIEIISGTGEVGSINTCGDIFTHYVTSNSTGFVEGCDAISFVSAFSEDETIIVGSILYSDGSLVNTLPEGFYGLVDSGEAVSVNSSGEVLEIKNCDDYDEGVVYWGGSSTATPSAAQVEALLFSQTFEAPASDSTIQLGYPDISSGDFVVASFPDRWFEITDITDITGTYSWFQDWERASDVTISGETYRVYVTVEEVANLTYDFKFLFTDTSGS